MCEKNKPVAVLLVEDDEIDREAIRRGFKGLHIANPIRVAKDGIEALEVLRGTNGIEKIDEPFLVLLDLNMPRMNGIEFLDEIRSDSDLKTTIVFVLTTSDNEKDRLAAFQHNVAGYMVKGKAGVSFLDALGLLEHYWRIVELPEYNG